MPRKKAVVETADVHVSTEVALIQPEVGTTKVTKRNLGRIQEKQLLENIEPMLKESFAALRKGIREGNPKFIELSLQVAGLVSGKAPSIINQINNRNNNQNDNRSVVVAETNTKMSFETIARKLDARDAAYQPPAIEIEAE
jgi:hypothetical protein